MDVEKAYRLALAKVAEHGLQDWDVMFDGARSRFGCCYSHKKLITLSKVLVELNDEAEVLDTILHEIAHGITPGGHTKEWRKTALAIGCNGHRCYGDNVKQPDSNYSAKCGRCGFVYSRTRRVSHWRTYVCSFCHKNDDVKVRLIFRRKRKANITEAIAS